jgi:hypothetical protein
MNGFWVHLYRGLWPWIPGVLPWPAREAVAAFMGRAEMREGPRGLAPVPAPPGRQAGEPRTVEDAGRTLVA